MNAKTGEYLVLKKAVRHIKKIFSNIVWLYLRNLINSSKAMFMEIQGRQKKNLFILRTSETTVYKSMKNINVQ